MVKNAKAAVVVLHCSQWQFMGMEQKKEKSPKSMQHQFYLSCMKMLTG